MTTGTEKLVVSALAELGHQLGDVRAFDDV
jgi:hypothetical protein